MCTVTWFFDADGYELFFNRDERRSRGVAEPPGEAVAGGVRYLAPTDRDAGGTWLTINQLGVAVGLLNAEVPGARTDGPAESRGRLVRELADLEDPSDLEGRLRAARLSRRMPFTLFALAPGGRAQVVDYDGFRLTPRPLVQPALLSSSSLVPGGAAQPRQSELERLLALEEDRRRARLLFHRSHQPERGPVSPCMHRPDARTVSFSHVQVVDGRVAFHYQDGPPCRAGSAELRHLGRPGSAASSAGPAGGA